jgi:hypothetical protein
MASLAFLEGGGRDGWVETPGATCVELLSDVRVCFEELAVLVRVRPDAAGRTSLGINLSRRGGSASDVASGSGQNVRRMGGPRSGRIL